MELFNEIKNVYFDIIFTIINESIGGSSKEDIIKIVNDKEFNQKPIDKNQRTFEELLLNKTNTKDDLHLLKKDGDRFKPIIPLEKENFIAVRFTNIEKIWLKALLHHNEFSKFFSKKLFDKLNDSLRDVEELIDSNFVEYTNTTKLPEIEDVFLYVENFKKIIKAIEEERCIKCTNIDRLGNVYKDKVALPVNIEYSLRDGRFRVSLYSISEERPILSNIHTLTNLEILEENCGITRDEAKKRLIKTKLAKEPIILEIIDNKMAMERCSMLFSGFERVTRFLGKRKYEMELQYYSFEEKHLINRIISLGPYVKVLSPEKIKLEVIDRFKKALELNENLD